MDGVTNTARVCSECGLDNSGGNLALLAQRIRRESLVARWTVWGGAIGAFACFASAKRLAEHWSYYAGTRSKLPHWLDEALMVAMILC